MCARKKARLTRRLQSQYNAIISYDLRRTESFSYPCPGWGVRGQSPSVPATTSHSGYLRLEWIAYNFAKQWGGRKGVDIKKLQGIVIVSCNLECIWRFSRDIPGASVRRLQTMVLERGSAEQLRKFAALVPNSNREMLEKAAIVAEVMNM